MTNSNTKNNIIHANSRNTYSVQSDAQSQITSDRNGKFGTNLSLAPAAPPKPPPPSKTCQYNSSDESSICDDNNNHQYECTLCNTFFDTAKEWKSHVTKSHLTTHKRKKKSQKKTFIETDTVAKNSKHKKK
eukprot:290729_1